MSKKLYTQAYLHNTSQFRHTRSELSQKWLKLNSRQTAFFLSPSPLTWATTHRNVCWVRDHTPDIHKIPVHIGILIHAEFLLWLDTNLWKELRFFVQYLERFLFLPEFVLRHNLSSWITHLISDWTLVHENSKPFSGNCQVIMSLYFLHFILAASQKLYDAKKTVRIWGIVSVWMWSDFTLQWELSAVD